MEQKRQFTAIMEREGSGYVALCPEIDITSQSDTVEEARKNLAEAIELFLEIAHPSEVHNRLYTQVADLRVGNMECKTRSG